MKTPSVEEIFNIHYQLVDMFKDDEDPIFPAGPKDEGLVYSAAERPNTGSGNYFKYTTVETKAAALFHSLVQNHPFHNGNKRTALVSMLVCLGLNDKRLEAEDDSIFKFVVDVAARNSPFDGESDNVVAEIASWLRQHGRTRTVESEMRVGEFLESCESLGCYVRETNNKGSWLVIGQNKRSIRINKSTKVVGGVVVRRWRSMLGIGEATTGVQSDEFQQGINSSQELLRQYREVLVRLANA